MSFFSILSSIYVAIKFFEFVSGSGFAANSITIRSDSQWPVLVRRL